MQPRNIEVFDGLRVTTEHIDHLQGAMHSAFEDFRGILGLGRIHRGFVVSRVDAHSVEVAPGLAFDTQRRRIVSDAPVRLEVPAAIATTTQFVCVGYKEAADGDVEGRPTRIWDSANVDVRSTEPPLTEDAIVIAELHPAEGEEGFTVVQGAALDVRPEEPPPSVPEPPPAPVAQVVPGIVARLGSLELAGGAVERAVVARIAAAVRARASAPAEGAVARESLGTGEAHAGVVLRSLAIVATAELSVSVGAASAPDATAAARQEWRVRASGSGHVAVADDGSFGQVGAGTATFTAPGGGDVTRPVFASDAALRCAAAGATPSDDALRDAWLAGLALDLRALTRNGDGFGVDAVLEWNGTATPELADWIEASVTGVSWSARLGWSALGMLPATAVNPPTIGAGG